MHVCSKHFVLEDVRVLGERCYLSNTAVPSLYLIDAVPERGARKQLFTEPSVCHKQQNPKTLTLQPMQIVFTSSDTASDMETKTQDVTPVSGSDPGKILNHETSGTESSATKRRKVRHDHLYGTSPATAKRRRTELELKYTVKSKELYKAKQKIKSMKTRISSLKDIVQDLRRTHALSTEALDHLSLTFGDVPGALLQRMLQSKSGSLPKTKYPEELKKFAFTLHFYSARAYDYVRETFMLALPHPSIIRRWSSVIECEPGFVNVALQALQNKSSEAKCNGKVLVCSLMLDEMSIKKQIDFDGKRNWGFVDVGINLQDSSVEPASEVLVLMVVSHTGSWKLPIAYFFIKSLTGSEKANICKEALIRLAEMDIHITSITCDGPSAHFTMFQQLGCNFSQSNMQTYFLHPHDPSKKVYAVFDICHMLKLLRNCLSDLGVFINRTNQQIRWDYIKQLYDLQEENMFTLANKLSKSHLQWKRQQMRVKLAAQTLSNSVAEALLFLKEELRLPQFQDCEATVNFIKMVDRLFDILNSRLPWAKGFKGPLKQNNEDNWRPILLDAIDELWQLKDVHGNFLWQTKKKTPFLGFIISIYSTIGIFDDFVKSDMLNYLLTYKLSQDHLELFFCSIRSRNGWNNNPSALQFMRAFKKLLLYADVKIQDGNCRLLDATHTLVVCSGSKNDIVLKHMDISSMRRCEIDLSKTENYNCIPQIFSLSEYSYNVVTYIAGYVIKMLARTSYCVECFDLLLANSNVNNSNYNFIKRRNLGAYWLPAAGVVKICNETEVCIRKLMFATNNALPSHELVSDIVNCVSASLADKLSILFSTHEEHHLIMLKSVIHCYCKVRLHNLAKKYTASMHPKLVRKTLTKLVLFNHQ